MAKWIRLLSRPAGASGEWHLPASDKEFVVADALCGERFPGPLESARGEERTSRDGRCRKCEAVLAARHQQTPVSAAKRSG